MNIAELLAEGDVLCEAAAPRVSEVHLRGHCADVLAQYDDVDERLVAKGFPATSEWWRNTFTSWYESGKRQLTARVGRRGGKSSSLSRLAVVEALYGHHDVPPGDVGVVAIISTDKSEALGRLRTIEAILDALGVAWKPMKAPIIGIELVGRNRAFRVFTASISGVSGFTSIFVLCDEVAKWKDNDAGVNPATEVLASVRPTMATQPNAHIVLSSSPMGKLDAHYDAFELGENALQTTAEAPTWVANPTITEEATHELEPDEPTRQREYGAVPMTEDEIALLSDMLITSATRANDNHLRYIPGHYYVATIDPATRGNAWTLAIAARGPDDVRRIVYTREWRGSPRQPLSPKAIFKEIATDLALYCISVVYTDQWAVDALRDHAIDAGLTLLEEPWTSQSKSEAYEELLRLTQSKRVEFPPSAIVKNDLLGIRKKLTRGGFVYELLTVHGRHSDFAPSIAMAVKKASVRPAEELKDVAREEAAKVAFLERLSRDKRREERYGRLPPTHRRHGT